MPSAATSRVLPVILRCAVVLALFVSALFVASAVVRASVSSHFHPALSWHSFREGSGLWRLSIGDGQFRLWADLAKPSVSRPGDADSRGWYAGATFSPNMKFDCSSMREPDNTSGISLRSSGTGMHEFCVVGLYAVLGSWAAVAMIACLRRRPPARTCTCCGATLGRRETQCPSCRELQRVRYSPMWLFLTPTIFAVAAPTFCGLVLKRDVRIPDLTLLLQVLVQEQFEYNYSLVILQVLFPLYLLVQIIVGLALIPVVRRNGSPMAVEVHFVATFGIPMLALACVWSMRRPPELPTAPTKATQLPAQADYRCCVAALNRRALAAAAFSA
jgi:hypothetical protein